MRTLSLVVAVLALSSFDLTRAKTRKPRDAYQGAGSLARANGKLNAHLTGRAGLNTTVCESQSVAQLQATLLHLFSKRSAELVSVYPSGDGRHSKYDSMPAMAEHWASLPADVDGRQRDGFCHEAVMWFVHHLTTDAQADFAQEQPLPLLPVAEHHTGLADESTKLYASKVTCQRCHVGGIDNLHVPEVKPTTPVALQRRCYTNYKDLFNITCGPCDGISGIYSGDDDKYFKAPACSVVAQPADVPEEERVKVAIPKQFTVDVTGSDRFGRTTNPAGSNLIEKSYGQISGKWYMKVLPGADQWFLRHDTTYHEITVDGHKVPFFHTASVSEIHVQSEAQRKSNVSGPMVSLIKGMPNWIPGGCTCIPDPVGVPDITAQEAPGMNGMEYMGRIKIMLEYDNVEVELDHWATWFFHIFMETDKSSAFYGKAPRRLASAYAGMAVYHNWTFADPSVADPTVWSRGIPETPEKVGPDHGKFCMNPKKADYCNNISQSTFPPPPDAPLDLSQRTSKSVMAPNFFALHPPSTTSAMKSLFMEAASVLV